MEKLLTIIIIIYWVAGYWAVSKTIWANTTLFYKRGEGYVIVVERALLGFFLGWVLIPWALVKKYLSK